MNVAVAEDEGESDPQTEEGHAARDQVAMTEQRPARNKGRN